MVVFLVLYVDDILLIGNDVRMLSSVKVYFSTQFDIKDLGEASHILEPSLCEIARKGCWAYPKLPISIMFLSGLAHRILRNDLFLLDLESLY